MKIRNGFVSNSSSSSFIVAFPHKPEDIEDLKKMLFNDKTSHYYDFREESYDVYAIARAVWDQIPEKSATKKSMIESCLEGEFPSYKNLPGCLDVWDKISKIDSIEERSKILQQHDKINRKRAENIVKSFISDNSSGIRGNTFVAIFEFRDNEGTFGEMLEHSNIFYNLPHIQISNH